ncbi:MAG: NAD-dependent epimerase/dehydratase family protein [Dehalococcoidia bacterium]|nr:NAD-dependent epimerase/dehydratase family protein [Dehalococcoidia bacterium]
MTQPPLPHGARVLVTGGAGFVGSHVVDALLAGGCRVLVIDNLSTGLESNLAPGCELVNLDIADPSVPNVFHTFQPGAIVHAAAQASVPLSVSLPQADARTNVLGTINLAQAAAATGVERFIYVNTGGALYGRTRYLPIDESHPVEPISPYGLSKWTAEQYLRLLGRGNFPLTTLRLANVYGPRQSASTEAGVISVFASRMLQGRPVSIHGDGQQTRDFVFVVDVARAVLLALAGPSDLTAHISTAKGVSVSEVFGLVAAATGYSRQPRFGPARAGDVRHSVLANARAREALGWSPEWALAGGIAETIRWMAPALERVALAAGA